MTSELEMPRGSVEFVRAKVTEVNGLDLNQSTIEIAVTGSGNTHTWLTAAWEGAQWTDQDGTHRIAKTTSTFTFPTDAPSAYTVYVRPTDTPEVPILRAGIIRMI